MQVIKLNFDAATNSLNDTGATVVVARNSQGSVLDRCCRLWSSLLDPLLLECFACREAILLTINRGFYHVIVEGNCLTVINTCKGLLPHW